MVLCKFAIFGLHFLQLSGFVMPKPVNTPIPGYFLTDEINTADWIFCTFEYVQSSHYLQPPASKVSWLRWNWVDLSALEVVNQIKFHLDISLVVASAHLWHTVDVSCITNLIYFWISKESTSTVGVGHVEIMMKGSDMLFLKFTPRIMNILHNTL
jgi:hypothetical protein